MIQLLNEKKPPMENDTRDQLKNLTPKTTPSFQIDLPIDWDCDRSCELLCLIDDQFESQFIFPTELFYELDGNGFYFLRFYPTGPETQSIIEAYVHGFFEGAFHS